MDYAREAERHRHMAEEYRALADNTTEGQLHTQYRILAEAYDALADNETRVAVNLKSVN